MTLRKVQAFDMEIEAWFLGALRLVHSSALGILLGSGGLVRLSGLTLIKIHSGLQHSLTIESQAGTVAVRVA